MPHAIRQAITGGGDAIGAVGCLSGGDGGIQVLHHYGAQPTGGGHRAATSAAHADRLPLGVEVGGTNGADCAGHRRGGWLN